MTAEARPGWSPSGWAPWSRPSPLPLSVTHPQLVRATARGVTALIAVTLMTLGVLAIPARSGPQGAAILVNQTVAGNQSQPSVAYDGRGNWATAWLGEVPGEGNAVFVRTSAAGQQRVSTDIFNAPIGAPTVSLGREGDGRFVVVWPGQRPSVGGVQYVTFARFYSVTGPSLTGIIEVSSSFNAYKASASVATFISGPSLVAWVVWEEQQFTRSLWARRVSFANGQASLDPIAVALPGVSQGASLPKVAIDSAGNAAVTWVDAILGVVYLAVFDPQFGALSPIQQLGVGFESSVARTPSGMTTVAWSAPSQSDSDVGIVAQRFDASGTPVGAPLGVNTNTGGRQVGPSVGMADDGRFVVAWLGPTPTAGGLAAWFQRFAGDEARVGAETRLNPTGISVTRGPVVSMGPGASYLTAWEGGSAADNQGIHQLLFTFDDPPVGNTDSYAVQHDSTLTVAAAQGLLVNDTDNDGDQLTVESAPASGPGQGAVALSADGSFAYTPNPGVGAGGDVVDEFVYVVTDGRNRNTASVQITISATNRNPPVANDDSYTTPQGQQLAVPAPGVLANDTDPDNDRLTTFGGPVGPQPTVGTAQLFEDGSFLYTPPPTYCGPATFTYYAYDGIHYSDTTATVTILIPCVQGPPEARPDRFTTPEDTVLNVPPPGVLANDRDPNLDNLVARPITQPAHGTLDLGFDGEFTYTPNRGFTGDDTFTYVADDGRASSPPATVTISVTAVVSPLAAVDDSFAVDQDGVLTVPAPGLLANDRGTAHRTLTVGLGPPPANGIVQLNPDGAFVYAPTAGYTGADTFGYVVQDSAGIRAEAKVAITVTAVTAPTTTVAPPSVFATPSAAAPAPAAGPPPTIPPPPEAAGAGGGGGGGAGPPGGGGGSGGAGGAGGDGEAAGEMPVDEGRLDVGAGKDDAVAIATPPQNGKSFANPDRTISYQPARHFTGRDEFAYSVCKGDGSCSTKTEGVTVVGQEDGTRSITFDPIGSAESKRRPGWLPLALLVTLGLLVIALVLPLARRVMPAPGGVRPPSPPGRRRIPKLA